MFAAGESVPVGVVYLLGRTSFEPAGCKSDIWNASKAPGEENSEEDLKLNGMCICEFYGSRVFAHHKFRSMPGVTAL